MGTTDGNGVYYPDVGETGWGDEVNEDLSLLSTAITDIAAHKTDTGDAHDASAVSFTPAGTVAGTDVQTAVLEVATDAAAAQAAHGTESSAHDAANVLFTPTGTIAGTDVQAAVAEVASEAGAALLTHDADTTAVHGIANTAALETTTGSQAKVDTHLNDASDAHDASAISFVPTGTIAAVDVQAAIVEVAAEAGASGAPTTADYLVGTAQGALSAEIVVGATPNGELGGTWSAITVDASHGGGTHAATQAAAEATAASALGTHGTTGHTETSAQYAFTGDISPTAISAGQDNYDPTGLSTASTLRLSTSNTTQRNITGLAGGADGRILFIHNVGPGPVAFIDEGGTSNAANRFALAGDMILLVDSSCLLQYDGTSSRWRMLARATAATNPALTFGTSNAGGTSPYFVRSDDQLALFDATVPSTQAFGDAAAAGAAAVAARRDHKHAMPAAPTTLANDTLWDAKGDLAVGTGADTATRVGIGTDFLDSLIPSSAQTSGLKWGFPRNPLRPTGALYETFPRHSTAGANTAALTSGILRLVAIGLPAGITITSISFCSGTTALATGTHQLFGLYDSSLNLLRGSTDDTSTAWAANAIKTLNLTSTYATTTSGFYYLGLLVTATTMPTMNGLVSNNPSHLGSPILAGPSSVGQTSLPDPAGAITGTSTAFYYGYVS